MSEERRLSNRSSISNTDHLYHDNTAKSKNGKFKFRNGNQSPGKQHISSSPTVVEVQDIAHIDTSNTKEQLNRLLQPPSKNINYDVPKIYVKLGPSTNQSSKVVYKSDEPICNKTDRTISPTILRLQKQRKESCISFKIANDKSYSYYSLKELPRVLNRYISQKTDSSLLPQRPLTKHFHNRVDHLLAQENQLLGNESIDLSFDGKALNKNDILRIVDSFSIAFDDDDDEEDEQYTKQPKNILPKEVTGVF